MSNMVASNNPQSFAIRAPAKLNLYLKVLGKRDDGFHELETLMTTVRIYDSLEWTPLSRDETDRSLSLELAPTSLAMPGDSAPAGETNLVLRAACTLAAAAGVEPYGRFTLTKRIPLQAGMGGGSSNAAAALLLANRAWGIHYPRNRLIELAAALGSDVPFFLMGAPAICRGRGEIMEAVAGLPRLHLLVIKPTVSVSTAEAFVTLNAATVDALSLQDSSAKLARLIAEFRAGNLAAAAKWMTNCFQDIQVAACRQLAEVQEKIAHCGAIGWQMTGSGSAFFAYFHSATEARRVAATLRDGTLGTVWTTSTC